VWSFRSPPWESVVYWSLDLETGGLEPRTDALLAVGMVPIRAGMIHLAEAYYSLVRPEPGARLDPGSVRAHQLVQEELESAPRAGDVVPEIARRLEGAVLLVHHRALDLEFLRRAFAAAGRRWPEPKVVDTVDLLVAVERRRRMRDPHLPEKLPALNLTQARRNHGLPDYPAHDALSDALATAELFLVLRDALRARTVRDLRRA
jgi:DNA polymerase III subunit epsilon